MQTHTLLLVVASLTSAAVAAPNIYASNYDVDQLSHAAVQLLVADGVASGTLIIRDNRALVLTNRHVVENLSESHIGVLLDTTKPATALFRAEVRGFSLEHDFAYLELTHELTNQIPNTLRSTNASELPAFSIDKLRNGGYGFQLPTVSLSQSVNLRRGDPIAIFGYPAIASNELVYSTGNVASVKYESLNNERVPLWYRTDTVTSQGNSGGLAVNKDGHFIGIPTSISQEYETGGRLSNILAAPFVLAMLDNPDLLENDWDQFQQINHHLLDFTLAPSQGDFNIEPEVIAEGTRHSVTAGGVVDAMYLGGQCVGYTEKAPDFRFDLTESMTQLSVAFTSNSHGSDPTLIISSPDSRWHCNDDANGLDPRVNLDQAPAGQYDVWVGNYSEGSYHDGVLEIASILGSQGGLNTKAEPSYGQVNLEPSFATQSIEISAGGDVDLFSFNMQGCVGYTASAPDVQLNWSGDNNALFMHFEAQNSGDDATLIIGAPNGQWYCNDDAGMSTLNPGIALKKAPAGIYNIWVGTYSQGQSVNGVLQVSEQNRSIP